MDLNRRYSSWRRAGVLGAVILLAVFAFATLVFSQATDGSLAGTVFDSSGAAVPSASLELVNTATTVKATAVTDNAGSYRFSNILVGTYKLTVTASGFKSTSIQKLDVVPNKTGTVNITLEVGSTSTVVEVTETGVVIDTTSAQMTNSFEAREAMDLPAAAASGGVLNLSLLGAGVSSPGGIGVGSGPSIGGQRPRNNNFMIEGVDNNRQDVTGPTVAVPNDAVASFTVLQNQFSAEFGHSNAGQFMTNVKSGTNKIHGVGWEYFNNRKLNALDQSVYRNCSEDQLKTGTCKARYDSNNFGGGVGGPILKNKLFYYGSFSYNPVGQSAVPLSPVLAPTSEGMSMLDQIPGLSSTNLGIFKKYVTPAPVASGDTISVNGTAIPIGVFPIVAPNYNNTMYIVGSMDYNPSAKDQLRGRWIYNKQSFVDTAAQLPIFYQTTSVPSHIVTFSEFHNFKPNLINEFRMGFNRFSQVWPVGSDTFPGLDMFPNIQIEDLNALNIGPDPNAPQGSIQNIYQLVDNVSWIKGKHTIKFGAEYRRVISPQQFTQRVRGDYYWYTLNDYLNDYNPAEFGERTLAPSGGNPVFYGNNTQFYWFVNDQWAIKPNLTLNLGLRHEWVGITQGQELQALNSAASVPGLITFGVPKSQKANFAPRVGIAYSPGTSGNTSIRAGFGMGYDMLFDNLGILSLPPQFNVTVDTPTDTNLPHDFLKNGGIKPFVGGANMTPEEARSGTSAYIPDQKRPVSVNWNLSVQHVWKKNYTFEARYVGTRGYSLPVQARLNMIPRVTADRHLPTYLAAPSQADLDALTLTRNDLLAINPNSWQGAGFDNAIVGFMPYGFSIYHGMALQANRRFSNGLMFIGAYTWSHTIDNSTAEVFSTLLTPRREQDFQNVRMDRSNSALDRRQRFSFSTIYELPFLKNSSNAFAKKVVGGWQLSGTYIAESPEYATVQSGLDSNMNGDSAGDRAIVNPAGTDGTGSGVTALTNSAGNTVGYLAANPSARYIVAGSGAWANGARNTLPLFGINNVDMSLSKSFKISERMSFGLRADMYNSFNHPQFTPGTLNNINPTSHTATRSFLVPSDSNFNNIAGSFGSNARTINIALKFMF